MQLRRGTMLAALALGLAPCLQTVRAAEAVSEPEAVWTDPSESLIWRTVMSADQAVSLDWPSGAVTARLTVDDGWGGVRTVETNDVTATTLALTDVLPASEAEERVLTLTLSYYSGPDAEIAAARQTATLGFVRGVNGTGIRCIPLGAAAGRAWQKTQECVVLPVDAGAQSLTVDGTDVGFASAPGWARTKLSGAGAHVAELAFVGSTYLAELCLSGGLAVFVR